MAKMLWVVHFGLVAAWLMMNGMSSLSTEDALTVGKNIYAPDPPPYPEQTFDLSLINSKKAYRDLIQEMQRTLRGDTLDPINFEIPRLVNRDTVPSSRRFFLINLINVSGDKITVAIDTTRLYVVGYRRGDEFHYFPDTAQDVDTIFPGLPLTELPFGSSYGALAQEGGGRSSTHLGSSLGQAIDDLVHYRRRYLARSFTVIIQMISEVIRFRYIENFVGNLIEGGVTAVPDQTMLDLENEWGTLSHRIQNSVAGTLNPAVTLTDITGRRNEINTVSRGLALQIGILFFVCNRSPNTNQLSLISTGGGTNCTNISEPIIRLPIEKGSGDHMEAAEDQICTVVGEPTVRIVGRNGLCAEVNYGYNDGFGVRMWPCKSNEDVNQLWTLKADGTIRSNGKCLTTNGYAPGNYVRIYNCSTADPDTTKWDIWFNGTILQPRSLLVLTATSGGSDGAIGMQPNWYASNQAWVVTNNTQLIVTPIMNNVGDMCLEAPEYYNARVTYRPCQSGERRQLFTLYPDSTIQPNIRSNCLTADTTNSIVVPAFCNGGAAQRWLFNRDYTISNLDTGLAIDVRNNAIFLFPREARESQIWQAWFF